MEVCQENSKNAVEICNDLKSIFSEQPVGYFLGEWEGGGGVLPYMGYTGMCSPTSVVL